MGRVALAGLVLVLAAFGLLLALLGDESWRTVGLLVCGLDWLIWHSTGYLAAAGTHAGLRRVGVKTGADYTGQVLNYGAGPAWLLRHLPFVAG